MPDSRQTKHDREMGQVTAFLASVGMAYASLRRGSDPPDFVVGSANGVIGIEVTEYHPNGHKGVQMRWESLRSILDSKLESDRVLQGIRVGLDFCDPKIPRQKDHSAIADEVIRCAHNGIGSWFANQDRIRLSFWKRSHWIESDWLALEASKWSALAKHTKLIEFTRLNPAFGFIPSVNWQAQSAWCSLSSLGKVLDSKERAVRAAVRRGITMPPTLWLLVVANDPEDISSFVLNSERLGDAVSSCGFNFALSAFNEVWMSDGGRVGQALRLHPVATKS